MKKLLIVTMLDYGYYSNNRVHHIVEQFKSRFEKVIILYKKVYIPKISSFGDQLKAFLIFRTSFAEMENITTIEMNPLFNHIDGFGINILGIRNPHTEVRSTILNSAKKALSNLGVISDLFFLLSSLFAFILRVRLKIDVFIGQGPWEAAVGYMLKKIGKLKVLVYDDFDYAPGYQHAKYRKLIVTSLENYVMKRSDIVISVSKLLGELREKQTGKKIEIIPNGVNYELFRRAQYKKPHPPTLIYMGYVSDWSGVELIVEALPTIKGNVPNLRFIVIGHCSPNYLASIKSMVGKLKLGESFAYLGNKRYVELVDYLKQADIGMALFKPIELRKYAFPLKVIEYMASGLPVIATRGTQAGITVEAHQCGEAIGFSADEFSTCVCSMLTDREKYRRYSENSKKNSFNYDWEKLMRREYELIEAYYRDGIHGLR
ncbi:MAG: glycosyltransferase family 4 protein [Candidatus Hodarchaeota archaeon]